MVNTVEKRLSEVAERIRELRTVLGISPDEAAGMTGLTVQEYMNYETGGRPCMLYRLPIK